MKVLMVVEVGMAEGERDLGVWVRTRKNDEELRVLCTDRCVREARYQRESGAHAFGTWTMVRALHHPQNGDQDPIGSCAARG